MPEHKSAGLLIFAAAEPTEVVIGGRTIRLRAGETQLQTFTCGHCSNVRSLDRDATKSQDGGMCNRCGRLLCRNPKCHDHCPRR